jgi:2-polyprenyl-3-methyl-5-hydroxy-6-metoxy-1,4-benzoquinol methylase
MMMLFASLQRRDRQPEIMDQPGLEPRLHHAALRGLGRINSISGSARALWPSLLHLARERPISVLDVGSGGGDVPIALSVRAQRAGLPIQFTGCDISPTAVAYARQAASRAAANVSFHERNVLTEGIVERFDIVVCSLFLHHLEEIEARNLLEQMRQAARHLVMVNDLARSRMGYVLAVAGSRILSRSRIVQVDGPRSVRAAFSMREVLVLAEQAGLIGATVVRRWPCRYLLTWRRR